MKRYLLIASLFVAVTASPAIAAVQAEIVYYKSGCDYFIAEGNSGYYLLEWYGGHDPSQGDIVIGEINTYGFKDVIYLPNRTSGRVWIDDYMLSKNRAVEKYFDKCD